VDLFSEEDKQTSWYKDILTQTRTTKSFNYLDDIVGTKLAQFLNLNLVFFNAVDARVGDIRAPDPMREELPFIFVYNYTQSHYEAVQTPNGEFTLDYDEGKPLLDTYAGTDKAFTRAGLSAAAELRCNFSRGDHVFYNEKEYYVVDLQYEDAANKKSSICKSLVLLPVDKGDEAVAAYTATENNSEQQSNLLFEYDGEILNGIYDKATKTYKFPMVKKVGEETVEPAAAPATTLAPTPVVTQRPTRLLKTVKENLRNWVTRLGNQSDAVSLQEGIKQQEDDYSAYKVDVPENLYSMSEQQPFYQFIASQFGAFKLPPVSPEIDEAACQALKVSPELTQYQKFIREYMRSVSPYRGILVYHGLGSGKTCTAIAAAESLYNSDPGRKIVVLTPSSLQENFVNELSFCGFRHYRLQNHWVPFDVTPALRQYAIEVMKIPENYFVVLNAAEAKAKKEGEPYTKQIWIPDFEQEPNFDSLEPSDQAQIRRQIRETVKGNITFIGYTGIGKEKLADFLKEGVFNNAVIVIDEVHNLTRLMDNKITRYLVAPKGKQSKSFEPIPANPDLPLAMGFLKDVKKAIQEEGKKRGQSESVVNDRLKQAVKEYYDRAYLFYRIFAEAKNSKLIALSGTPIVNYPTELAICLNFLHGYFYTCSFTVKSATKEVENKLRDYCKQHPKIGFFEVAPKRDSISMFISLIKDGYVKKFNEDKSVFGVEKQFPTEDEKELLDVGDVLGEGANIPVRRTFVPTIQDIYTQIVEEFKDDGELKDKIDTKPVFEALPLFPVDRETFTEQFIDVNEETAEFNLKADMQTKFGRRLAGLISYYKGAKKDFMPSSTPHLVNCVMSSRQLKEYNDVRTSELQEKSSSKAGKFIDTEDLKEQQSSYRFASRSASNFAFPEKYPRPRPSIRDLLIMAAEGSTDAEGADLANQTPEALTAQQAAEQQANQVQREESGEGGTGREGGEGGAAEEGQTGGMNGTTQLKPKRLLKSSAFAPTTTAATAKAPEEDEDPTKSYPEKVIRALDYLRKNKDILFSMDDTKPEKERLSFYSRKFHTMITNILAKKTYGSFETDVSSLVYSAFKTVEGLGVFSIALEAQGFVQIKLAGTDKNPTLHADTIASFANRDHDGKRYILYTGDYSPFQRQVLLNIFNCNKEKLGGSFQDALAPFEHNQTGQLCRVFMITGAGAEGLSLKNVRRVHIMEPYWNKVRTDQVQGRAIRICSHMDLPYSANSNLNQRHVDVYTYLSVFPENAAATLNETIKTRDIFNGQLITTDSFINMLAGRKEALSKDFLGIAQQMAVDCTLNVTENKVDCLGVVLASQDKSSFFYDPRLEKDLGTKETVAITKKTKTPIEEAGGVKQTITPQDKTKKPVDLWFVKREEGDQLFYDIYKAENTGMTKKVTTYTEQKYKSLFASAKGT
jgi:hypothetical protein